MHQDYVGRIFLHCDFLYNTGRHRECGDSGAADHRVDLLLQEQVDDLRKHNTANRIHNECEQTDYHDHDCLQCYEVFRLHTEGNRDSQKQCDQICQIILRGVRHGSKNAALTDQVTEHQETNQRYGSWRNQSDDDGNNDRERNTHLTADILRIVFHMNLTFFQAG